MPDIERHTIAVLVANEPGVLARVIGLFSGRGYNIESLTVAEVDRTNNLSRITVVTSGTRMIIEQIKAQLSRLVPVHKVHDLTDEGPSVEREMALIKVAGKGEARIECLRLADIFRARFGAKDVQFVAHHQTVIRPDGDLDTPVGRIDPLDLSHDGGRTFETLDLGDVVR